MSIISTEEANEAIRSLYASEDYIKLRRHLHTVPFLEVIGKSHSETAHSAFLAWLFDTNNLKSTVVYPVLGLLRLLAAREREGLMDREDRELSGYILTNRVNIKEAHTKAEASTKSEKGNGRADIEILVSYTIDDGNDTEDKSLRIVIENKIEAKEGENQCAKYFDHYSHLGDGIPTVYVFLAPSVNKKLSSEKFISITYQDILNDVLTPIMHDQDSIPARERIYIELMIENLTSLRSGKSKIKTPIAMDENLKALLTNFYQNNEELIYAAIEAAASDEVRDKLNELKNSKDYSSYELAYNTGTTPKVRKVRYKSQLAKEFVEAYIEMHPGTTLKQIQTIMDPIKKDVVSDVNKDNWKQISNRNWFVEPNIWGQGSKYFDKLQNIIKANGIELKTSE